MPGTAGVDGRRGDWAQWEYLVIWAAGIVKGQGAASTTTTTTRYIYYGRDRTRVTPYDDRDVISTRTTRGDAELLSEVSVTPMWVRVEDIIAPGTGEVWASLDGPGDFVARIQVSSTGALQVSALLEAGGSFTRRVSTQAQLDRPEGWTNTGSPTVETTTGDTPILFTAWEIERIAGHKIPKLPGSIGGADIV